MTHPQRIQLSRKKGWRKPEGAVLVSRPSKWGNPYQGDGKRMDHAKLRDQYARLLQRMEKAELIEDIKRELRGKDLACWCPEDKECHADVLMEIANSETPDLQQFLIGRKR